ncbi:MAG: trypsin-like peptidase domain-containing protein [Actinomycetota bacterium]|nr:trypsin-like peptidase domain-containing protein [Actinomycetota bacterium]
MTKFARSLLLVMFGLAFLPLAATAAPEKPNKTTLISAYVGPSIVYVAITWKARVYEGLNARYAGDETGAEPGNAVVFEINSHCTGYVVNHDGYIATAGHCLDPKEQLAAFKVAAAEWAVERNKDTEWFVGDPTVEEVLETAKLRVDSAVEDRRNPDRFVTASWGTEKGQSFNARVVSYQRLATTGDAGLIKVDATGLQAIRLAESNDLETGTEVVSIGYPGKVKDVTDEDYAPSYKDGQINSRKTIGQGILTVYEVSTGMAGGMSGGPTVNLAGDVVGFNSFGASAETEQFNFVGPTSMVKELMADAGIKNDLGSLSKNYNAGLDAYFDGDKDRSVSSLQAVLDEQPRHELALKYLRLAKKLPDPFPIGLVAVIGAGALAIIGGGVALLLRRTKGGGDGQDGPTGGDSPSPAPYEPSAPVYESSPAQAAAGGSTTVMDSPQPVSSPIPATEPSQPAGFQAPAGQPQAALHFCAACGTKVEPGARFCFNCGKPV